MNRVPRDRIAFVASPMPEAQEARRASPSATAIPTPAEADVIVALGGDGLMLQTLHRFMKSGKPIYGMHRGTVGFLMNDFREDGLAERLAEAQTTVIHPLLMRARDAARGKRTRPTPSTRCRCSARPIRRRGCAS